MTLQQYFACLAKERGVETFIILNDDATNTASASTRSMIDPPHPPPPPPSSSSKSSPYQNIRKQTRTPQEKFLPNEYKCSPPSCPSRKTSDEDLRLTKKQKKKKTKTMTPTSSSSSSFKNQSPVLLGGADARGKIPARVSKQLLHRLYTDIKVPPRCHVRTNPSAA